MTSIADSVATEALGLAVIDGVTIISGEKTVLIVESILNRVLLVVQVRNAESVEISLTLDRVKYECSASGYFGGVSKFDYQHKSVTSSKITQKLRELVH
ncbi:hypothetical protein H5410_017737 [Solanum commersonii]|uniref:Uncharacterized protein n=1 Tax=Solanum commersonii TaxID=4109 RepID=A0A9J6A053_SOLCO|nr:hypothetical protein H5410_017737 [Solanum commersonii]